MEELYHLTTRRCKAIHPWFPTPVRNLGELGVTKRQFYDVVSLLQPVSLDFLRNNPPPEGHAVAVQVDRHNGYAWKSAVISCDIKSFCWLDANRTLHTQDITGKYIFWSGVLSGHHNQVRVQVSDTFDIIAYLAYKLGSGPQPVPHRPALPDISGFVRILKRKFELDVELFKLTNPDEPLPTVSIDTHDDEPPATHIDPDVHRVFAEILDKALETRTPGYVSNFTGYSIGDVEIGIDNAQFMSARKNLDIRDVLLAIKEFGYTPVVGILPKAGVIKSNGKTRLIYPMHLSYEAVLRKFFADAKIVDRHALNSVNDYPRACGHSWFSYDVTSCDRTLWPYLIKYASDRDLTSVLVPTALTEDGLVELNRFPSGVFGTDLITKAFTLAIAYKHRPRRCKWYVHGDAIISTKPFPDVDILRRNEDSVINGFRITCHRPVFVNGFKFYSARAKHPYLHGAKRFAVLHAAHRLLGIEHPANPLVNCTSNGTPYTQWSARDIQEFCSRHNSPPPRAIEHLIGRLAPRSSTWDSGQVVGRFEAPHHWTLPRCWL